MSKIPLFSDFKRFQMKLVAKRWLVNVRSHMMFRPELIYIFDLIVNQMKG